MSRPESAAPADRRSGSNASQRARWICAGIAALWWPGAAAAAPRKATHRPTEDLTSTVGNAETLLRRGRALSARGRHAEAVTVLDAALRDSPDDPVVLNELGVALRKIGDLARAEQVCRDAAKAAEPSVRASALYNLGRVLEQRRDTAAAIDAYRDSLQLHPTRSARDRLVALDPAFTTDATRTHGLQGPVPSMEQWCSAQQDDPCGSGADRLVVSLPDPDRSHDQDPSWRPGHHAPWDEARVIVYRGQCAVGLRTKRGWFVERIPDCAAAHSSGQAVQVELEAGISGAEGHALQIRFSSEDPCRVWDPGTRSTAAGTDAYDAVMICGLGPSGIPHCTSSIPLVGHDDDDISSGGGLTPRWAHGLLILDPDAPVQPPQLRTLAGSHRVIFP